MDSDNSLNDIIEINEFTNTNINNKRTIITNVMEQIQNKRRKALNKYNELNKNKKKENKIIKNITN